MYGETESNILTVMLLGGYGIRQQAERLEVRQLRQRFQVTELLNVVAGQNDTLKVGKGFVKVFTNSPAKGKVMLIVPLFTQAFGGRTYTIRLLFRRRHFNRARRGKPSNLRMSLSEKSIVSY